MLLVHLVTFSELLVKFEVKNIVVKSVCRSVAGLTERSWVSASYNKFMIGWWGSELIALECYSWLKPVRLPISIATSVCDSHTIASHCLPEQEYIFLLLLDLTLLLPLSISLSLFY